MKYTCMFEFDFENPDSLNSECWTNSWQKILSFTQRCNDALPADQNDKTVLRAEGRKFFTVLGANPEYINHIKSATEGGSDSLVAQSTFMNLIRFKFFYDWCLFCMCKVLKSENF